MDPALRGLGQLYKHNYMCYASGGTKAQWGECNPEDTQAVHELLMDEWLSVNRQGNGSEGGTA